MILAFELESRISEDWNVVWKKTSNSSSIQSKHPLIHHPQSQKTQNAQIPKTLRILCKAT